MANSKAVIQKWSQSLTRGFRLRTFPSVVITGKDFDVLDGCSPMGGGRTSRFDCITYTPV